MGRDIKASHFFMQSKKVGGGGGEGVAGNEASSTLELISSFSQGHTHSSNSIICTYTGYAKCLSGDIYMYQQHFNSKLQVTMQSCLQNH